jgi:integrase
MKYDLLSPSVIMRIVMAALPASRNPFVNPELPTFADLIERLAADGHLPLGRRRNLMWGLRAVARAAGKQPDAVPAHPAFLRNLMKRAAPKSIGLGPSAWNNARSFCGKALEWAGLATMPAHCYAPLSPAWATLREKLPNRGLNIRLSRFCRFCSVQSIAPTKVNDEVLSAFYDALLTESIVLDPFDTYARTIKAWNKVIELVSAWPKQRLMLPSRQRTFSLSWTAFPSSLKDDVALYLRRAAGVDLLDDHFIRPQRPATLRARRYQLQFFATAIVQSGISPGSLVDLRAMLVPEITARGLQYLLDRNYGTPTVSISHLANFLPSLARRLDMADEPVAKLRKIAKKLAINQRGMTARNRAALRAFDDDAAVVALLMFPQRVLNEVSADGRQTYKNAKLIQTALGVEILLNAPVRIHNLASINLTRHLVEVVGSDGYAIHLQFPSSEVKNYKDLEFPLGTIRPILNLYLTSWRPLLCHGPSDFLFPGKSQNRPKRKEILSAQIRTAVFKYTGLDMPPHRFRHAAAKIYLDRHPGQYEVVRLFLGHTTSKTTTDFYAGAETATAARLYAQTILGIRSANPIGGKDYNG